MGKHKKNNVPLNEHKPCPFCGSYEVAPAIGEDNENYRNMMMLCLGCFTRFEFEITFSMQNVSKLYSIWDKRCSDGEE